MQPITEAQEVPVLENSQHALTRHLMLQRRKIYLSPYFGGYLVGSVILGATVGKSIGGGHYTDAMAIGLPLVLLSGAGYRSSHGEFRGRMLLLEFMRIRRREVSRLDYLRLSP